MAGGVEVAQLSETMSRINQAWLTGKLGDLEMCLHEQVSMVFPGFQGATSGRERMLAGFRDFCENAVVLDFVEAERHVDVVGNTGVASFRFTMTYERDSRKYESRGRDLWVFERGDGKWYAVWRTMLELRESEVD